MNRPSGIDWAMIGCTSGDGVIVLASTELDEAQLETERLDDFRRWDGDPLRLSTPVYRHRLTVEMRAYVQVFAPTYAEAFAHLFGQWQPPTAGKPEQISARSTVELTAQ